MAITNAQLLTKYNDASVGLFHDNITRLITEGSVRSLVTDIAQNYLNVGDTTAISNDDTSAKLISIDSGGNIKYRNTSSFLSTISNGSGTTVAGTAVNWGGTLTADASILGAAFSINLGTAGSRVANLNGYFSTTLNMDLLGGSGEVANIKSNTGFIQLSHLASAHGGQINIGGNLDNTKRGIFFYTSSAATVAGDLKMAFNHTDNTMLLNLGFDAIGDVYTRSVAGTFVRIGIGTNGYVFTSNGAGAIPSWQAAAGGGGGAAWGGITGTLSAQSDLNTALGLKSNLYLANNRQIVSSYQIVLADVVAGLVEMNNASANSVVIPPDATLNFPIGSSMTIVQYNSGQTSVVAGSGAVTIRTSSGVFTSPSQYSPMVIEKIAANEWYLWNGAAAPGGGITLPIADNLAIIKSNADASKLIAFSASGLTTATTRTYAGPDFSGALLVSGGTNVLSGNTSFDGAGLYSVRFGTTTNLTSFTAVAAGAATLFGGGGNYGFTADATGLKFTVGSDATGDFYYRTSAGYIARLPIGTDNYVMTVISGLPSWQPSAGGGGGVTSFSATNGFAGSILSGVATLSTTISGLLKGNGSAMIQAVKGADVSAPIGDFYVNDFSGIVTGYTNTGSATATVSGGLLNISGGTLGTTSNVITLNTKSSFDYVYHKVRFKVNADVSGEAIGIGFKSVASYSLASTMYATLNTATSTNRGQIKIHQIEGVSGPDVVIATSTANLTYTNGDILEGNFIAQNGVNVFYLTNITAGTTSIAVPFSAPNNNTSLSDGYMAIYTGAIYALSGNFSVITDTLGTEYKYGPILARVGDSITAGYFSGTVGAPGFVNSEVSILRNRVNGDVVGYACGGNRSLDILNSFSYVLQMKPRYMSLMIGINDINGGISLGTTSTVGTFLYNVQQILNQCFANSITPILYYILPTSNSTVTTTTQTWNSAMVTAFGGRVQFIDAATSMTSSGVLNPTYDSGDGTHLGSAGQGQVAITSLAAYTFQMNAPISAGGSLSGLTTNRIPYATSSTTIADSANLIWDNTNRILTVGQSTTKGEMSFGVATGETYKLTSAASGTGFVNPAIYPSSGTNTSITFVISPKGTGKAGLNIFGSDFIAGQTNYELLSIAGSGTSYDFGTLAGGTGTVRPISLYTGSNANQLLLSTNGNITASTKFITPAFQLTTAPTAGYYLQTDASGNASWAPAGGLSGFTNGRVTLSTGSTTIGDDGSFLFSNSGGTAAITLGTSGGSDAAFNFHYKQTSGTGFVGYSSGTKAWTLGFNNQATFAGTINTISGRQFVIRDEVAALDYFFIDVNGQMWIGPTASTYGSTFNQGGDAVHKGKLLVGGGTFTSGSVASEVQSITGAFLAPRMSTTQKTALTAVDGSIIYDNVLTKFQFRENGAWTTISSGSGWSASGSTTITNNTTQTGAFSNTFALNTVTLTQNVITTGSPSAFVVTGGAHTTLTASTEATDINFNLARTVQFATGGITTQRVVRFQAPTYGFVASSTITTAATVSISGAPIAGTNAAITNALALYIEAGNSVFQGDLRFLGATRNIGTFDSNIFNINTNSAVRTAYQTTGAQTHAMTAQASSSTMITWTQPVHTGGTSSIWLVTGGALTGQATTAEVTDLNFNLARTITWATGAIATQRSVRFQSATLAFAAASTVTLAASVAISGAPTGGTNATLTASTGLSIETRALTGVTTGSGMVVNAPTGATTNYAAQLNGALYINGTAYSSGDNFTFAVGPSGAYTNVTNSTTPGVNASFSFGAGFTKTFVGSSTAGAANITKIQSTQVVGNALIAFGSTGAQVVTDAINFLVSGAYSASTNASITNSHGAYFDASTLTGVTNGFALTSVAPTGATNNWAAQFTGGIGIKVQNNVITSGFNPGIRTISASATLTATDYTVKADATSGTVACTLPTTGIQVGQIIAVKKKDSTANTVTIATVDGGTKTISVQNAGYVSQWDGTVWSIIGSF